MTFITSKQGTATISIGFEINGVEQLKYIVAKLRSVESVLDIERTTG
jgi:GTP pyrophosphokinase